MVRRRRLEKAREELLMKKVQVRQLLGLPIEEDDLEKMIRNLSEKEVLQLLKKVKEIEQT